MTEKSRQKFSEEGIFWHQLYKQTSEILAEINIERPEIEARWIIEKASGYEGSEFVTGLDERATVLGCLLYTSPSPRDGLLSRMPSSA